MGFVEGILGTRRGRATRGLPFLRNHPWIAPRRATPYDAQCLAWGSRPSPGSANTLDLRQRRTGSEPNIHYRRKALRITRCNLLPVLCTPAFKGLCSHRKVRDFRCA